MALQNFVDDVGPAVASVWLNKVDTLFVTVFGEAQTKAAARTALDVPARAGTETISGVWTFSGNNVHSGTNKFSNAGQAVQIVGSGSELRLANNTNKRITFFTENSAYALGTSGGAAIQFVETAGSQEIAFETHAAGISHAERFRIKSEGELFQTSSKSGELAEFRGTASGGEIRWRYSATAASSGVALQLSNGGNNNQISQRLSNAGNVDFYGGQTAGAASTSGALWASIASTGLNVQSGSSYSVAGTVVLSARKTGWSTATGTATRTAFDTSTVTTAGLAERVKALIDDLHATAGHGLIGT